MRSINLNSLRTRVGISTYRRDGVYVTDPVLSDNSATYTPGLSERRSNASTFFHSGIKNTHEQTSANEASSATRQYDAFGNVTSSSGTWKSPFGYAGGFGYQEDASELKLLGHRYYDSSTGRFLTRDPIKDGRNWYGYCENNPLAWVDPSGLKIKIEGFTAGEEKILRKQIDQLKKSPHLKQMLFELVNDSAVRYIKPLPPGSGPHLGPKQADLVLRS